LTRGEEGCPGPKDIHHVSGHCCTDTQGQRSKVKVMTWLNAIMAEVCISMMQHPGTPVSKCEDALSCWTFLNTQLDGIRNNMICNGHVCYQSNWRKPATTTITCIWKAWGCNNKHKIQALVM